MAGSAAQSPVDVIDSRGAFFYQSNFPAEFALIGSISTEEGVQQIRWPWASADFQEYTVVVEVCCARCIVKNK